MGITAIGNRMEMLEEWGIVPPNFRKRREKLVRFVLGANGNEDEKIRRIELIKKAHGEWVGKKVRDKFSSEDDRVGKVLCLNAKSERELKRDRSFSGLGINPLNVLVLWGNKKKEVRNFASLEVIEE